MITCPEVAILMATYNGEKYLSDQLESLLRQRFSEESSLGNISYKVYIHDDGSSDNTVSVIRSYAVKYPDIFEIIDGPSTGSAKNNFIYLMREVVSRYTNERLGQDRSFVDEPQYYFFCDQDDVWQDNKLQVELKRLKDLEAKQNEGCDRSPVPSLVWCDMKVVDESLNVISQSFSQYSNLRPNELSLDRCIMHGKAAGCSMACNASLVKLCCEIESYQDVIMHDWALILIAKMIGRLDYIDLPLVLYRQHGDNSLGAINEGKVRQVLSIIGRLLTMKQLKATQVNLRRYIAQVASLKQIESVYQSEKELIDGAYEFNKMNRMERVHYVNKYRMYRHKNSKIWSAVATFLMK